MKVAVKLGRVKLQLMQNLEELLFRYVTITANKAFIQTQYKCLEKKNKIKLENLYGM